MKIVISILLVVLLVTVSMTQSPIASNTKPFSKEGDLDFSKATFNPPPKALIEDIKILTKQSIVLEKAVAIKVTPKGATLVTIDSVYNPKRRSWIKRILNIN